MSDILSAKREVEKDTVVDCISFLTKTNRCATYDDKIKLLIKQQARCANKPGSNLYNIGDYECLLWKYKDQDNKGVFDDSGFEADHIVEYSICKDSSLSNLQLLCSNCHTVKTANFNKERRQISSIPDDNTPDKNLKKNKSVNIKKNKSVNIKKNKSANIKKNKSVNIKKNKSVNIKKNKSVNIKKNKSVNNKDFSCHKCKNDFKDDYNLNRHLNNLTDCVTGKKKNIKQYKCEFCESEFTRSDGLLAHHKKCKIKKFVNKTNINRNKNASQSLVSANNGIVNNYNNYNFNKDYIKPSDYDSGIDVKIDCLKPGITPELIQKHLDSMRQLKQIADEHLCSYRKLKIISCDTQNKLISFVQNIRNQDDLRFIIIVIAHAIYLHEPLSVNIFEDKFSKRNKMKKVLVDSFVEHPLFQKTPDTHNYQSDEESYEESYEESDEESYEESDEESYEESREESDEESDEYNNKSKKYSKSRK